MHASSYYIETGKYETSTRIDEVTSLRFDTEGVSLLGENDIRAFAPYGSFIYIKNAGPQAKSA